MLLVILSILGILCGLGAIILTDRNWDHYEKTNTVVLGVVVIVMGVCGVFFNLMHLLKALA